MASAAEFLREAGVYFIATTDGDQPHLRPFGSNMVHDGKFYISTGGTKAVYTQMKANSKVSLSAMKPNRDWIRIVGKAIEETDTEAKAALIDSNPRLKEMYANNPDEFVAFRIDDALCTVFEAGKEPAELPLL